MLNKHESEIREQLYSLGLLTNSDKQAYFTIEGALLFAPKDKLPNGFCTDIQINNRTVKSLIKNYHGECLSKLLKELLDDDDCLSTLWQDEWEDPSVRNDKNSPIKVKNYPKTAIVEALVNFIIHRNYEVIDQAFIIITNEYVEFINPGISAYSADELLSTNEPLLPKYNRNQNIIHAFARTNLNQRQGGGIIRIREALSENGNIKKDGGIGLEIKNDELKNRFSLKIYKRQIFFLGNNSPDIFHVDLSRLPKPASNQFIGRKDELKNLHQAFNNRAQTGIVAIIADGGIGKSALTDEWITALRQTNYDGIKRVFAWSFYSQGSHQNTFSSSQDFFTHALPFFGFDKDLPQDDVDKARALAQCLTQQAGLLLLDGLEPLQHPVDQHGEMADVGMKEFFLQLHHHRHAHSFVLISSRQAIVELDGREDYQALVLNTLNETDGAALLQALKVTGTNAERQAVSRDLHGHALSLVLLAELLRHYHKGDIRYAKELPPLVSEDEDDRPARFPKPRRSDNHEHAKRVLSYYDKLISDNERRFMYCLSLLHHPMQWQEKNALFANAEYAAPLAALSECDWQALQAGLEAKGLLLKNADAGLAVLEGLPVLNQHRTHWDTHPLIRQFFATQFKQQQPAAFQQAHRVLFEYFQTVPEKHQPDTLAELEPLYRAMLHGCLAGEHQKALDNVYQQRILRGVEHYSTQKLGAYSQDLIALSAFFPRGWSEVQSSGLSETDQAWLLSNASFCLMSLGRLAEAVAPCETGINSYVKLEDWKGAANSAEGLADLLLPLGKLADAETAARQSIDYALRTEDKYRQMANYSKLATVLHRQGLLSTAQETFAHAEQLQTQDQPDTPYLYSIYGAQYCALLLDTAHQSEDLAAILTRAKYGLKSSTQHNQLLSIAFDYLTLARTYSALAQTDTTLAAFTAAILAIQKAGKVEFMPEFYLTRASFHLSQNELVKAKDDIDTANQTITRCGMKLYAVDAGLLLGRYYLAMHDKTSAQSYYDQAAMLIAETGHHLRDKDLIELKRAL